MKVDSMAANLVDHSVDHWAVRKAERRVDRKAPRMAEKWDMHWAERWAVTMARLKADSSVASTDNLLVGPMAVPTADWKGSQTAAWSAGLWDRTRAEQLVARKVVWMADPRAGHWGSELVATTAVTKVGNLVERKVG